VDRSALRRSLSGGSRAEVEELMSANAAIRTSVAPMLSVRQGARAVEFYKAAFESA
jgi:hypothetical protein